MFGASWSSRVPRRRLSRPRHIARRRSPSCTRPRLGLRTRRGRLVVVRPRLRRAARVHRASRPPPPPRIRDPVVIYEDDDVLAVHKPAGMSFHNDDLEHHRPGVLGTLRELQARGALPGSDYDGPLHAVHRLDKVTSGALLFAKTPDAAAALAAEFRARRVHKYYVALSARRPSKKMGTVAGDMARTRRGAETAQTKKRVRLEPGGNPRSEPGLKTRTNTPPAAVTRFVARGVAGVDGRPLRMFVMRPLTGKTHQLRVSVSIPGSPILGDASYAGAGAGAEDRAYLHAAAIRFAMPARDGSGRRIVEVVCAPTEGVEWSTETLQEAWASVGVGSVARTEHLVPGKRVAAVQRGRVVRGRRTVMNFWGKPR